MKITVKSSSISEIRAAQYMEEMGYNLELRDPKGSRAGGATSDIVLDDGTTFDVYTPKTSNVDRIISAVRDKNSQTKGVIIDLHESTVVPSQLNNILDRVQGAGGTNIEQIIIIPKKQ